MNFEKYKNKTDYPKKPEKPRLSSHPTKREVESYLLNLEDYEKKSLIYKEKMEIYQTVDAEIHDNFRKDLFEDLGISNNPKKDLLYSKAWENGHSAGFSEVYNVACDLVDLIK